MSDAVPGRPQPIRPTDEPIRLIDEKGAVVRGKRAAGFSLPDSATLLDLYRRMVVARRFEAQVTALTRQGRLATYPSTSRIASPRRPIASPPSAPSVPTTGCSRPTATPSRC